LAAAAGAWARSSFGGAGGAAGGTGTGTSTRGEAAGRFRGLSIRDGGAGAWATTGGTVM
jgi:hypothetical protein